MLVLLFRDHTYVRSAGVVATLGDLLDVGATFSVEAGELPADVDTAWSRDRSERGAYCGETGTNEVQRTHPMRRRASLKTTVAASITLLVLMSGSWAAHVSDTSAEPIETATPTATATVELRPDLAVLSITDAQQGAPCSTPAGVDVVVANIGSADAGPSTTLVSATTAASQYLPTPGLSPGTSVTLHSSVNGIPIGDTYTATSDVDNVIAESNETNNSLSVFLALGTFPTCTPSPSPIPGSPPTFTPTPTLVCADVNGDGVVNLNDVVLVARRIGSRINQPRYDPRLDLNHDGDIDVFDLMLVLKQLGTACP